jgi:hypothetical protein
LVHISNEFVFVKCEANMHHLKKPVILSGSWTFYIELA